MKRFLAYVLAIALGASAGLALAQMAGGVMDSQSHSSTTFTGVLPVTKGGTGVTTSTGSGSTVLSTSPALTTPNIGAASGATVSLSGTGDTIYLNNARAGAAASIAILGSSGANDVRITGNNDGTMTLTSASGVIAASPLRISTGTVANQLRTAQTTAPTCTTNCGTSPSVAGTDTFGIVTMGASGVPASAWVVQFNGTWAAAPSCIVQSALSTMVVGKMPIAVVTTTTTMTVTTNGTAPATSDKYQYHCGGVS